uniref:Auxin-responsive protein n=1 Tax=Oryza punctata TaxID=4537 RepID=A0A0E0KGK2_ORYPU
MGGLGFDETELRLGLPGAGAGEAARSSGKRGFAETIDLKLKLQPAPAVSEEEEGDQEDKEDADAEAAAAAADERMSMKRSASQSSVVTAQHDHEKPRAPNKLRDDLEYVPTYEDKDGDWMLVGDVPWDTKGNGEMQEQKLMIKEN